MNERKQSANPEKHLVTCRLFELDGTCDCGARPTPSPAPSLPGPCSEHLMEPGTPSARDGRGTITLRFAPTEDEEITCLYCNARPCAFGLDVIMPGKRQLVGLCAACRARVQDMGQPTAPQASPPCEPVVANAHDAIDALAAALGVVVRDRDDYERRLTLAASSIATARREALEEAAKVCERFMPAAVAQVLADDRVAATCNELAARIRAL